VDKIPTLHRCHRRWTGRSHLDEIPYFDRNDGTVVVASPKLTLESR